MTRVTTYQCLIFHREIIMNNIRKLKQYKHIDILISQHINNLPQKGKY